MSETIVNLPTVPTELPTGTPEEIAAAGIQLGLLGLQLQRAAMLGSGVQHTEHMEALKAMEKAATERHKAAQDGATARHAQTILPFSRRTMAWSLACTSEVNVAADSIARAVQDRWQMLQRFPEVEGPDTAPAPAPEPATPPAPTPAPPSAWRLPPLYTEAEFVQLRGLGGFNAGQGVPGEGYLASLADTGATHARVWYQTHWDGQAYVVDEKQRQVMQAAVRQADDLGVYLVICVQIAKADMPWGNPAMMQAYVALLADLAREHQGQTPIAAWDLTNEPDLHRLPEGAVATKADYELVLTEWRQLATACTDAIRAVEPGRLVVYQVGLVADPSQFELGSPHSLPLDRPGVIHSAHFYEPDDWTHQNVPELVAGQGLARPWRGFDAEVRAAAQASLDILDRWSARHGKPIYVGEISAVRFAPGAHEYVRLVTDFCREKGWPFSYHEWRGWWGWDAELVGAHEASERVASTPMLAVLRNAFKPRKQPPLQLDDEEAVWYLAQLAEEFKAHKQPATLVFARQHWAKFGRPQGRKWAPDAPAPAWGPLAKDAPAGTKL